jgi:toxin ParE1/3/4
MAPRSRQKHELGSGTTQDHRNVSSYRLRIDPLAEDDLSRAYQWYERQRPGLGGEFLNNVDKCFRRIVENPAAFQMVRKAARRALLARFPYCVYFIVVEWDVVILACLHGRRSPSHLERRN